MKTFTQSVVTAAITLLSCSWAFADQTGHVYGIHDRSSKKIAFTNAVVHVEPGKTINNATLIIENGRISSVERKGSIPKSARVIDLNGHSVYPGFIDPYSHYIFGKSESTFTFGEPPKYEGDRTGGKAWNEAIHAEIDWVNEFSPNKDEALNYINNGFTTVQTAKLDGIFQGQSVTVSLADDSPSQLIYNANSRHFGSFNKGSSKQSYPSSLMGSIALIRQTLSDAKWYKEAKGKTDHLITGQLVEYNAALEELNELSSVGLIFNSEDHLSTLRADKLFKKYDLDITYIADGHEYTRIKDIKSTNSTFIHPADFPAKPNVNSFEDQLDVSLAELRHWERAPSNPAVLAKNKVPFAFTQYGLKDNKEFWKNIRLAVQHGLSEKDALAALTTVPAKLSGIANQSGKLTPGMIADFVITDGNIFADGKIKSVYLQGKEHSITPISVTDFSGTYTLNINSKKLNLELKQDNQKVSGSVKMGDEQSDIKVTYQKDDTLRFTVDLSKFDLNGVYRFSNQFKSNALTGFYLTPESSKISFTSIANNTVTDESKSKDDSANGSEKPEYISQLTTPNRAFGFDRLPKQQDVHFKNATVWTSEKAGILENTDILISNGEIEDIGKNLSTPSGYQVIDATGKHITAGIIDEHSHIAISKGVNEGSDAITSEVNIGDVVNPNDISIYRALAGGTTTAQLLHGSANPIGGQAQVIKLRWGSNAEQMKFKAAPGSIKFALGENVKQSNWGDEFTIRYPQTRMGVETIVRDAFLRAKEYKASWEKYDDLSRSEQRLTAPPRKNYRLEILNQILENKRFVHSHSYVASEILSLMKIAEDFGFRIQTFTHILEGYKVAKEMAEHGATASTFADWWAYKFEVYDAIPGNTCLMMKNGVNVSVNSDSNDLIRRLNTEAAKSINYCNMKPEDAIKMITINPAIQLKVDKYTGSIKADKHADLVLWSGNPLSNYSKVEQTWIDGKKYFDREEDAQVRQSLAKEKNQLIQKILSNGKSSESHKDSNNKDSHSLALTNIYIAKTEPAWHCEDNFDFWAWQSSHNKQHNHQRAGE
ncbi:amidohydrolase family protein [Pleionea sediminis]|uniref:amidohydrolase family protein n=1 Tax=Pleionea sediminis TaxID=2569479 RepID=UPI001185C115|nr:amidohydrolase family protein [Pleionea sediminis]